MSISNAQLLACTLSPLSCLGHECTLKATFVGNKIKTKMKLISIPLHEAQNPETFRSTFKSFHNVSLLRDGVCHCCFTKTQCTVSTIIFVSKS